MQTVSFEKSCPARPTIYRFFYCGILCGFLFKKRQSWKCISFENWAPPIREFKTLKEAKHYVRAWYDENVLIVSLSSSKYKEFKDFPESDWKRLRETLGFTEEKERE